MENFFEKLKLQLEKMTPEEKDAWILEQAKILPEWKQEDFYKSVCGTKKVIDMPERDEITEFCEKVSNGEITVKYETHYVEFDDFGHYHDGWEHDFYDPDYAMTFVSSVLSGCHDLIVLEEYGEDRYYTKRVSVCFDGLGQYRLKLPDPARAKAVSVNPKALISQ